MRRLTRALARRAGPARLRDESGAVAVFVALTMTIMLGCAAIAVDVSSAYADRHQLQNGADAAALAIALDCARNSCGDSAGTATTAVRANTTAADAGDATIGAPTVTTTGRTTTVTARATSNHFFGQVLGQASHVVTARSSASWIATTRGRANFPLAISWCEYMGQIARHPLGNTTTYRINATTQLGGNCNGPSGTTLSGYAVTQPDTATGCRTTSTLGNTLAGYVDGYGNPYGGWNGGWYGSWNGAGYGSGYGLPAACTTAYLGSLYGSDLLIPVWDQVSGSGTDIRFRVYGYAAFHFVGADPYSSDPALIGYFTYAAQQADATTASTSTAAPDLGARSVYLSK
jgi:Flp pilus assembly protein TadG